MSHDPFDHALERGLRNRRAVLGDAWVDASTANANDFNAEFQSFITRFAWHEIWGRPGLETKVRRIIVLAITCALGRWDEFDLHVRAALAATDETRLTPDEIKEVSMQAAIYAGVPAANTAITRATALLRELDLAPSAAPLPRAWHPGVGRSGRTASWPALHSVERGPRHGRPARHTIVLAHALGCDAMMWDDLAQALAEDHRVIAFDARGHGQSDAPPGAYTMADLADDAVRLLDELDTGPVVWVGVSMGGMVGQELAVRDPARVEALIVANSTCVYSPEAQAGWARRIVDVRAHGLEAIADATMQRWFGAPFRASAPATVARWRQRLLTQSVTGYLGCCEAVRAHDTAARLSRVRIPTLVIAGELDGATPVEMSQDIARRIANARCVVLDGASHLSVIEQPAAFEAAVLAFLATLEIHAP